MRLDYHPAMIADPAPNRTRIRNAGLVAVIVVTVIVVAIAAAVRSQQARPRTDIARGEALYAAHCASCHGANLEGQPDWKRPLADGSLPAPPHDISGHTWHHGDGELRRIIDLGGTIYMPESKMPGFGATLTDEEIAAILSFIKTRWTAKELGYQAEITAGEVGPGTTP